MYDIRFKNLSLEKVHFILYCKVFCKLLFSLKKAAQLNNLNSNTAKFIWQQFKTKNNIIKRKKRIAKKFQAKVKKI